MNDISEFVRVAKAISDPNRVKILKMLEQREMCACELVAALSLAQPTVSKHLKQLVEAGLILSRKEGAWTHYRLPGFPATQETAGPQAAMLAMLRPRLNDDKEIRDLCRQVAMLSPESLKCSKG